jgi:transposase
MKSHSKTGATGAQRAARSLAYPVEFRLRIVKFFLEEGYRTGF